MGKRLVDKVAIITGAGSIGPGWGNGRATTVRFTEEGAKVFAIDRDSTIKANCRAPISQQSKIWAEKTRGDPGFLVSCRSLPASR